VNVDAVRSRLAQLDEKRAELLRPGMTVVVFIDGPSDGRVRAAKVMRVIDHDTVELEFTQGPPYARRSPHTPATRPRLTATYAGSRGAPRPANSWDFIV
jgi:hypothetical protein